MHQAAEGGEQGEGLVYWLENDIERYGHAEHGDAVEQTAREADAEECLMREDIARGLRRVGANDQAREDAEIDSDHGDEGEQVGISCDSRGRAL